MYSIKGAIVSSVEERWSLLRRCLKLTQEYRRIKTSMYYKSTQGTGKDAMSCTHGCKRYQVNIEILKKLKRLNRARRRVVCVLRELISH